MSRNQFIFLIPLLIACTSTDPVETPYRSNSFYTLFVSHDEKTQAPDSIIAVDRTGKRSAYAMETASVGEYPYLYKDRLISLVKASLHPNLVTLNLMTGKIDTICSDLLFLRTSSIDEYDGLAVIRDYDKYAIIDVAKKRVLKESECYLENILLTDSGYFLIRVLNDISEPKPYLCSGTIEGTNDTKLIDLPDSGINNYQDATTYGWNGMKVHEGILFIHTFHQILAYDIEKNRIVDQIPEERTVYFRLDSSKKPTFLFEKERIVFHKKKLRFKRI